MSAGPILYLWDGQAMRPAAPAFYRRCNEAFEAGKRYTLVEQEERSDQTHKHQFAWLREAWQSLPEKLTDQFPTPEHLRKKALIECGFYDETIIDVGTKTAALRVAVFLRTVDEFAHVVVREGLVVRRVAKSQSRRTMGKEEFARSKSAILDHIAALLEVDPERLRQAQST
jgi:hypothetical protein